MHAEAVIVGHATPTLLQRWQQGQAVWGCSAAGTTSLSSNTSSALAHLHVTGVLWWQAAAAAAAVGAATAALAAVAAAAAAVAGAAAFSSSRRSGIQQQQPQAHLQSLTNCR